MTSIHEGLGARPFSDDEERHFFRTLILQELAAISRDLAVAAVDAWPGLRGEEPVGSGRTAISEDTYRHLVDLAKDGNEAIFKEYAGMVGVKPDDLDALWTGTRSRLPTIIVTGTVVS